VPFTTITVLRPPVERTLSYLRHQRKLNRADGGKTLEQIYDDPFRFNGLIRNHMTRMLSMTTDELVAGDGVLSDVADTPERLARAKDALTRLDHFGLQPRFEELCSEVSARYGIDLGEPLRSNATDPIEAPEGLVERIAADNALDMALYDEALRFYEEINAKRAPAT
jgi:hypothetical protein